MSATIVISIMVISIGILLFVGAPLKPVRWTGQVFAKLAVGALLLFFFNVICGAIGLHIPINLFTVITTGFLGVFGLASLSAIHIFIL